MNWLPTIAFAVLLLSIRYDAAQSASPASKSPWADLTKARSFMDCLMAKIASFDILPQEEKEDLESIMDTLMSAVSEANARGKSSGAQLQAINMAIASSLAEIVVADDAGNQTSIAVKTQALSGALVECFRSVMGTVDRKFINEINDLITMFAKEEASDDDDEEEEEQEEGGEEQEEGEEQEGGEEQEEGEEQEGGEEQEEGEEGEEEQEEGDEQEGEEEEQQEEDQGDPSSSSSPETSQSVTDESSDTFQDSSKPADEYEESETQDSQPEQTDVTDQVTTPAPIDDETPEPQPEPDDVGSQDSQRAVEFISRVPDKQPGTSKWRNRVRQKTVPSSVYPNRLSSSSSFQRSQSPNNTYQPSQTFQSSSQMGGGYGGTYDEPPQFSEPTPIDIGRRGSQSASGQTWRVPNELSGRSTLRRRLPQQTVQKSVYPNRPSSSSFQTTSQSVGNPFQSYQPFRGSSQTSGGYGGIYPGSQFSEPAPIGIEPQVSQPAPGYMRRMPSELRDKSTLRRRLPQQKVPTSVYSDKSSSFQKTSEPANNTYQSSQTFQGPFPAAGGYGRKYRVSQFPEPAPIGVEPQVSQPLPIGVRPQVSQPTPEITSKPPNELPDTSTRRTVLRRRLHHKTVPKPVYPNRTSSLSFQTSQPAPNAFQSNRTFRGPSQKYGGYGRTYTGSQFPEPTPIDIGPQVSQPAPDVVEPQISQPAPGFISKAPSELPKESTRRTVLRKRLHHKTVPSSVYPSRSSSSSFRTSPPANNTYQPSQTFQSSSETSDGYGGTYPVSQFPESIPIVVEPQVSQPAPVPGGRQISQPAPGFISRAQSKLPDESTRRTVLRKRLHHKTIPTPVFPSRSSSSFQTSSPANNTYQPSQTFQSSSETSDGYGGTYPVSQFPEPVPIFVEPQVSQPAPVVGPQISQPASGFMSREQSELPDESTRRTVLRRRLHHKTIPASVYPSSSSSSSFQTSQSTNNTYQSSQTFQSSSQTAGGGYGGPYPGPQEVAGSQAGLIPKVANALANSPTLRAVLRRGVPQQIASNLILKSVKSLANTLGVDGNDMNRIALEALSQLPPDSDTPDYSQALSNILINDGILNERNIDYLGPRVLSAVVDGISSAADDIGNNGMPTPDGEVPGSVTDQDGFGETSGFPPAPASEGPVNEGSYNVSAGAGPSPDLPVLSALNSPNGLRSDPAGARIIQMTPSILDAISPSGVDADALARYLQVSVWNLRSSGMPSSDAKLEALFELATSLLQITSNAQINGINMFTAPSVTSSAARSFELALA